MAARDLGIYPHVPFYRAMFEAAGVAVEGRGWSDEMLEASVVSGDEDGIAQKIAALFEAGADEVALSPFGAGPDPAASQADCIRVLSEIAKG
jgi:alkanesulfonate monooxygenase SsuD/methylene tetrahydromethanopterin reductase-like flavin-dependent oxidoreductase (luciferase family)